jgi:hypothetical protein
VKPETKARRVTLKEDDNPKAPKTICNLSLPSVIDDNNQEYRKGQLLVDAITLWFRTEKRELVIADRLRKKPIGFQLLNVRAAAAVGAGEDYASRHSDVVKLGSEFSKKIGDCTKRTAVPKGNSMLGVERVKRPLPQASTHSKKSKK